MIYRIDEFEETAHGIRHIVETVRFRTGNYRLTPNIENLVIGQSVTAIINIMRSTPRVITTAEEEQTAIQDERVITITRQSEDVYRVRTYLVGEYAAK